MSPKNWKGPTKTIGVTDLWDKTLGIGSPTSPNKAAGKQNARWSNVDLTGGGPAAGTVKEYDVPHDLGSVPTVVTLMSYENAAVPDTFIAANGVRRENWSASHVHVSVRLISGSLDGCVAHFLVQGR